MAALLRFVAFFAALVAVLLLVVLPLAATPFLTQIVRDMGVRSDSLSVSVELFDPLLAVGRARRVHVFANNASLAPVSVETIDITLSDASFFDRSWETVSGDLKNVSLVMSAATVGVESIHIDGPANAASATARLSASQTETMVRAAAAREGLSVDSVRLTDSAVRITVHGLEENARLAVRGGALVLLSGSGSGGVPLIQPAPSDPWQLSETWISDGGLNISGVVDTTRLARGLKAAP